MAFRVTNHIPRGYRGLGKLIRETDRAALCEYYTWELWIPKRAIIECNGWLWAPAWAIDSAKAFETNKP